MATMYQVKIVDSLQQIDPRQWDALAAGDPFLCHAFLSALHDCGCACADTGWEPLYLTLWHNGNLAAALPLYLKNHSCGEYVFDYAWAEAFERHGLPYYPKLLSAVPFTPVSGARLLATSDEQRLLLAKAAIELAQNLGVSSLHILFPHQADAALLREAGYLLREGVQFHWHNQQYTRFDDYLAGMTHNKRKKLRQERRRVMDAGIQFSWLRGEQIQPADLAFFHLCYLATYHNHRAPPYLSLAFFQRILAQMPDQLLLIKAERDGEAIACALNMLSDGVLYGRYWGSTEFVSCLHFETCYSQAIDYCIEHRIQRFEGGAQGEHKLARGLLPSPTWSAHWIANRQFAAAIENFLQRETRGIELYRDELEMHSPFKHSGNN